MRLAKAILAYALLGLILLVTLVPIGLLVEIALAEPAAFINRGQFVPSLDSLRTVFLAGTIWPPLWKSLGVALATAAGAVAIAAPGAYVLAKLPGKAGYLALILIFFTRMIPEVGVALPIALNFARLGLFDTAAGLVLAHLVRVLPLVAWVLIGTFKAIPRELEEAGRMDGGSPLRVLLRVVLPVATPGLAVGLIFGFLNSWDEFIYATYLTLTRKTLPLMVYYYVDRGGWFLSSTYALVVTLPVLVFTYAFQRRLQSGMLAGAVKG